MCKYFMHNIICICHCLMCCTQPYQNISATRFWIVTQKASTDAYTHIKLNCTLYMTLTCSWYHHHLNHRSLWCPVHCSSLWWHSHTQPGVCPYGTAHSYEALKQKQYSKMNNVLKCFWSKAQELLGNVKQTTKETEQTMLLYALSGSRSLSPERHDWLRLCLII